METQRWLESGEYLPDFMRDFHDQKDLFKAMDEVVERSRARAAERRGIDYLEGVTWTNAQVYTVDIFLWVMARNGYTLQRSRKRLTFGDICAWVAAERSRRQGQMASVLSSAFDRSEVA